MAVINEYFAVVKDEFLIAVDPKNTGLTDATMNPKAIKDQATAVAADTTNKPFKSFAWSQPVHHLGMPVLNSEKSEQD